MLAGIDRERETETADVEPIAPNDETRRGVLCDDGEARQAGLDFAGEVARGIFTFAVLSGVRERDRLFVGCPCACELALLFIAEAEVQERTDGRIEPLTLREVYVRGNALARAGFARR